MRRVIGPGGKTLGFVVGGSFLVAEVAAAAQGTDSEQPAPVHVVSVVTTSTSLGVTDAAISFPDTVLDQEYSYTPEYLQELVKKGRPGEPK